MSEYMKTYRYRHIARVTVEAATPIAVGSGVGDIVTDSPVVRDVNGLPYIPATSLAGVLRHALAIKDTIKDTDKITDEITTFGYHSKDGGLGSCTIFTDAVMVGKEGKPMDGIKDVNDEFYAKYMEKDVRQHVRIDESGVAADGGKFDNEVVYKGTRFTFEMELVSATEGQGQELDNILEALYDESLRFGSGTRCGYGKLTIVKCERADLDFDKAEDLEAYISKSSCLSQDWERFAPWQGNGGLDKNKWQRYVLQLQPRDFLMFGAGMGDEAADNIPVSDLVVTWNDGKPSFSARKVLIPATSVKGALAHRTAYNYNKSCEVFADKMEETDMKGHVGGRNKAVSAIFGMSCDDDKDKKGSRGNIILNDVICEKVTDDNHKLFFHIKNDTFTGGTIPGALFQEKCVYGNGETYELEILVSKGALQDKNVEKAFEQSLKDICNGLLPLGGVTGRGNGMFTGTYNKEKGDGTTD